MQRMLPDSGRDAQFDGACHHIIIYAIILYLLSHSTLTEGGSRMKMERLNVQLPAKLKAKLDALRGQGTSASGFVRFLIEREFCRTTPRTKQR